MSGFNLKSTLLKVCVFLLAFTSIQHAQAQGPTVLLESSSNNPTNEVPIPLDIIFSSEVSDFTVDDIDVTNATVDNLRIVPTFNSIFGNGFSGHLNSPNGIDIGPDGKIYIADGNFEIKIFDENLNFLTSINDIQLPNGESLILSPQDVTVGEDGKVYILNNADGKLYILDAQYNYLATIGESVSTGQTLFNGPNSVAIGPDNKIYIADTGNDKVDVYNADFSYHGTIGLGISINDHINRPTGVAISSDGRIFISDLLRSEVKVFNPDFTYNTTITNGSIEGVFFNINDPLEIAIDDQGNLYIVESNQIKIFSTLPEIQYLGTIGENLNDPSVLSDARDAVVRGNGQVLVTNNSTNIVSIFDTKVRYRAQLTPIAHGAITAKVPAGIATDINQQVNEESPLFDMFYDIEAPTLSISVPDQPLPNPFQVTFQFDEIVTGFELNDLTSFNSSLSNFSGAGDTYTVDVNANFHNDITLFVIQGSLTDLAGNSIDQQYEFNITYDITAPTATITTTTSDPTDDRIIPLTFNFDEEVVWNSFPTVDGGELGDISGDGTTYYADLIPNRSGVVTVTIPSGAVYDQFDNVNELPIIFEIEFIHNVALDNDRPSVVIGSPAPSSTNLTEIPMYVRFSEPVSGFQLSDIVVEGGTLSALSGTGSTYNFMLIPDQEGEVSLQANENVAFDNTGNGNRISPEVIVQSDVTSPSGTFSIITSEFDLPYYPVKLDFDEQVTFLNSEEITIENGSQDTRRFEYKLSYISEGKVGPGLVNPEQITVSNTGETVIYDRGSARIFRFNTDDILVSEILQDIPGGFQLFDNVRDLAFDPFGRLVVVDDIGERVLFFNEDNTLVSVISFESLPVTDFKPVSIDFGPNGISFVATEHNIYQFDNEGNFLGSAGSTFHRISDIAANDFGSIFIAFENSTSIETIGSPINTQQLSINSEKIWTDKLGYFYILARDNQLHVYSPELEHLYDLEDEDNFHDLSDFAVDKEGKIHLLDLDDRSIHRYVLSEAYYSLEVTADNTDDVIISLAENAVTDAAGNNNVPSTFTIPIDFQNPTVTITSSLPSVTNVSPIPISIVFDEEVVEFGPSKLGLINANLVSFSQEGNTYNVLLEPFGTSPIQDKVLTINIDEGDVTDLSGNPNEEATFSIRYDTDPPLTFINPLVANPEPGDSFDVLINFSEPVIDFDLSDIVVTNATLGELNANSTESFVFQITPIINENVTISVNAGVATDIAGNPNVAADSRTIQLGRPIPTLSTDADRYTNNPDFLVNISFNEEVVGFTQDDINVTNGFVNDFTTNPYTASIIADNEGEVFVSIPQAVVQDTDGKDNVASNRVKVNYNNTRPTVLITPEGFEPSNPDIAIFNFDFDKEVVGFGVDDISLTAGSVISLEQNGEDYLLKVNVVGLSQVVVRVEAGVVNDLFGNPVRGDFYTLNIDRSGYPIPSLATTVPSPTNNSSIPIQVSFNEQVTGFSTDDLQVTNGTINRIASLFEYSGTIGEGVQGNGDNQFLYPSDITIHQGKIYITDSNNHRVQIFDLEGNYLQTIGGIEGSGNDQFDIPSGVAFGPDNKMYVVDIFNKRIQIFNSDLSYHATLGQAGNSNYVFSPQDVVVGEDGKIYVADAINHRIQVYNADLTFFATIGTGSAGSGNNQFFGPLGLTIHEENLYITDVSNNRIQIFDLDLNYVNTIGPGASGWGDNQLDHPRGIAFDNDGNIYVADRNEVIVFNSDLSYQSTFGEGVSESDNYAFDIATDIAVAPDGQVYVVDNRNQRVQFYEKGTSDIIFVTPTNDGLVTIDFPAGGVKDLDGNSNVAADQLSLTFDSTPPVSTITAENDATNLLIQFNFSETIESLEVDNIVLNQGVISTFTQEGDNYNAIINTAGLIGNIEISLPVGSFSDLAGNTNVTLASITVPIDDEAPVPTLSTVAPNYTNNDPIPVEISFNENITGLELKDFAVTNGTISDLTNNIVLSGSVGILEGGSTNDAFMQPSLMTIDQNQNIYVADVNNHRVQIFDKDLNYLNTLGEGLQGSGNNQFNRPFGVAISEDGKILVTDSRNYRVQIFNADLSYFGTIGTGTRGVGNEQFSLPLGIRITDDGRIYVADVINNRVQIFNTDYTYFDTIGTGVSGVSNNQLNRPHDVCFLEGGKIAITDRHNNRIQIFDEDRSYLHTIGIGTNGNSNEELHWPVGISTDVSGNIYVGDYGNHRVQVFDSNFNYKSTIGEGVEGVGDNQFRFPWGVTIGTNGKVYVSDAGNNQLKSFEILDVTNFNVTPTNDGLVTIDFPEGGVQDLFGNDNVAAEQLRVTFDSTSPTATLGVASDPTGTSPVEVSVVTNEEITGLIGEDFNVINGTVNTFNANGVGYTLLVTPASPGEVIVSLPAGTFEDLAGNVNAQASEIAFTYDNASLGVSLATAETTLTGNTSIEIVINFDDEVDDFTKDDLTVINGTVGRFFSLNFKRTYVAIIHVNAQLDLDTQLSVKVNSGSITTADGQSNAESNTLNFTYSPPYASDIRTDQFKFNWSPVARVVGYEVRASGDFPDGTGVKTKFVSGTQTGFDVAPLTDYTITIRAQRRVSDSDGTDFLEFNRLSPIVRISTPPAIPEILPPSDVRATSFVAAVVFDRKVENYYFDLSTDADFTALDDRYANLQTTSSLTVTGLIPGQTYYYRFRSEGKGFISSNSETEAVRLRPEVPVALPATDVTGTHFVANWQATSGVEDYILEIYRNGPFLEQRTLPATFTSLQFGSFSPGDDIRYRLKARNSAGESAFSDFITFNLVPIPFSPINVNIGTISNRSFEVSWQPDLRFNRKAPDDYLVEVATEGAFTNIVTEFTTDQITAEINSLQPNAIYFVRITARNIAGVSPVSVARFVRTLAAPPTEITFSDLMPDSFTLNWNNPWNYDLYRFDVATDDQFVNILPAYTDILDQDFMATIINLEPATTYYVRIRASVSSTDYSPTYSVTTPIFAPVEAPVISDPFNVTTTEFSFDWNDISNATSYVVETSPNFDFRSNVNNTSFETTDISTTIAITSGRFAYYYRVAAKNEGGIGPFSDSKRLIPLPDVPVFEVSGISSNNFQIDNIASRGAADYRLDISASADFSTFFGIYNDHLVTSSFIVIDGLESETRYYVRMRAVNETGTSDNSALRIIETLDGTPPVAILTTSDNNVRTSTIEVEVTFSEAINDDFTETDVVVQNGSINSFTSLSGFNNSATLPFTGVTGVISNGSGEVITINRVNHYVSIYDERDQLFKIIGTPGVPGSDLSEFNSPSDIALDINGNIYVADAGNQRIQIFDSSYEYLNKIDLPFSPESVTVDEDGKVYIAFNLNHQVRIYNSDLSTYQILGTGQSGDTNQLLNTPFDVTVSGNGDILVVDQANGRIQIYDQFLNYIQTFDEWNQNGITQSFGSITRVETDRLGNIYVIERSGIDRILVFDKDFEYVTTLLAQGLFSPSPNNFYVDNDSGELFVSTGEVMIFDIGQKYLLDITPTSEGEISIQVPADVFTDLSGNLNIASDILRVDYDVTAPSITITSTESSPTNSSLLPVTIEFNESVVGFVQEDLQVINATITSFSNDGNIYTVEIDPIRHGLVEMIIPSGVITDLAGNTNVEASFEIDYDIAGPRLSLLNTFECLEDSGPILIEIELSEQATSLQLADIGIENGIATDLIQDDRNLSFTVTPEMSGYVRIQIPQNSIVDALGNGNPFFVTAFFTDQSIPEATLSNGGVTATNDPNMTISIALSESVNDFSIEDISVQNANVLNLYQQNRSIEDDNNAVIPYQLRTPKGIALDQDGNLYVADNSGSDVKIFDQQLGIERIFDMSYRPWGIARGEDGKIYVGTESGVFVYSNGLSGDHDRVFGGNSRSVHVDAQGQIYVVNQRSNSVDVYNSNYGRIRSLSVSETPWDVTTDDEGNIYVISVREVLKFNSSFERTDNMTSWEEDCESVRFLRARSIDIDESGNIYISDCDLDQIKVFDQNFNYLSTLEYTASDGTPVKPIDIHIDKENAQLYVSDLRGREITVVDLDATYYADIEAIAEGEVRINIPEGRFEDFAGNENIASNQLVINYDITNPVATVTSEVVGGVSIVSILLSEPVIDFTVEDIELTNAVINSFSGAEASYQLEVTTNAPNPTLTINPDRFTDLAGNGNPLINHDIARDDIPPTVVISSTATDPTNLSPFPVLFTFSEEVVGFTEEDIVITNGQIDNLSKVSNSTEVQLGTSIDFSNYTHPFVPARDVAVSNSGDIVISSLFGLVALDANAEEVFHLDFSTIDRTGPLDGLAIDENNTLYVSDRTTNSVRMYDGDYQSLGDFNPFAPFDDVYLTTPATIQADGKGQVYILDNAQNRILVYTTYPSPQYVRTINVDLAAGISDFILDSEDNLYLLRQNKISIHNNQGELLSEFSSWNQEGATRRFANLSGLTMDSSGNFYISDQGLSELIVFNADFEYLYSVKEDFNDDIISTDIATGSSFIPFKSIVKNGKLYVIQGGQEVQLFDFDNTEGSNTYQALVTPESDGEISVSVTANAVNDLAGNPNVASEIFTITSDRIAPELSISSQTVGLTVSVIVDVNENIGGFDNQKITLLEASLLSYTVISDRQVEIQISQEGFTPRLILEGGAITDAAGNNSIQTSYDLPFDRTNPTVLISSSEASLTNASPIPIKIEFSEPVTGFSSEDILVDNGIVEGFSEPGLVDNYVEVIEAAGFLPPLTRVNDLIVNNNDLLVSYGSGVVVYDLETQITSTIDFDLGENSLELAQGMAVDQNGVIYITDRTGSSIHIFDSNYQFLQRLLMDNPLIEEGPQPKAITTNNTGQMYVLDDVNKEILIYDIYPSLELVQIIRLRGNSSVVDIITDNENNLYVLRSTGLNKYNSEFQIIGGISEWEEPDGFSFFTTASGVSIDQAGNFYISDGTLEEVVIFDNDFNYLSKIDTDNSETFEGTFKPSQSVIADDRFYLLENFLEIEVFNRIDFYQAYITPSSDGDVIIDIPESAVIDQSGNPNVAAETFMLTSDRTAPEANISLSNNGPNPVLTIDFNESVEGFELLDITSNDANLSNFVGSMSHYEVDISIAGEIPSIIIENETLSDLAGNFNNEIFYAIEVDDRAPNPILTYVERDPSNADNMSININFREEVTPLDPAELVVTNAQVSALRTGFDFDLVDEIPTGFSSARGMAFDQSNQLYVLDAFLSSVSILNPDRSLKETISLEGVTGPTSIFIDNAENIYISTAENITVYNSNFELINQISGDFNSIQDVFVDAAGKIYVADFDESGSQVQILDADFNLIHILGNGAEGTPNNFINPYAIFVDDSEQIYVVDRDRRQIQIFDNQFNFIATIGDQQGVNNYRLSGPRDLIILEDKIYIADTGFSRVLVLDKTSYELLGAIQTDRLPYDIAIDQNGIIATNHLRSIEQFQEINGSYVVRLQPISDGPVTINLPEGIVSDLAGNPNIASQTLSILSDRTPPEVAISSSVIDNQIWVRFDFNEAIGSLSQEDIKATDGRVTGFFRRSGTVTEVRFEITGNNPSILLEDDAFVDQALNYNERIEYQVDTRLDVIRINDDPRPVTSIFTLQDEGEYDIQDGGRTINLTGNAWKTADFNYTITPHTILEFDFESTDEGEIQGVMLTSNTTQRNNQIIQLYGSQTVGVQDYNNYEGGIKHYEIYLGEYQSGEVNYITFLGDEDRAGESQNARFSNIYLREDDAEIPAAPDNFMVMPTSFDMATLTWNDNADNETAYLIERLGNNENGYTKIATLAPNTTEYVDLTVTPGMVYNYHVTAINVTMKSDFASANVSLPSAPNLLVNGISTVVTAFDNNQDAGRYTIEDAGSTIHLTGNSWKTSEFTYEITNQTIMEFDFRSLVEGEIHGIMLTSEKVLDRDRVIQLYGIQNLGVQNFNNYSGTDWKSYQIVLSDFFTGEFNYITFLGDDDRPIAIQDSEFRNIIFYEDDTRSLQNLLINSSEVGITSLSIQDKGTHLIEDEGRTIRIDGNTWKTAAFSYDVKQNTILEFDFRSTDLGEIQGVMLTPNKTQNNNVIIQLAGSQTIGIQDYRDYTGTDWKRYRITLGDYIDEQINHFTFVGDEDRAGQTQTSYFRDIVMYDEVVPSQTRQKSSDITLIEDKVSQKVETEVSLFPNPMDTHTTIIISDDQVKEPIFKLYDVRNKEVPVTITAKSTREFELVADRISGGVYVLVITLDNNQTEFIRIVKN